MKDGGSLSEDKLPVLKAKDGYKEAKWTQRNQLQRMIQNLYQVQQNWRVKLILTSINLKVKK
ncbi:hypothetical protein RU96_GL001790 [Enterococcus canintestini]|uniref:Uncharacterized protein n=1 Tax=Enterococcus canintestini TaxID=317010 RepID=A0A1L8R1U6_9ENTE|nr:hypothetical protein RU96_GL001790 [Enterococcus canintestini]